ncbi:GntR family transcriptional regulator [Oceanobacillus bengalensis]|uniref:GntR family transcriptional regulator n=1 Tax=Oceanobacillus bengalensis TaxID=1435466 RepID=A0A494YXP5_9BACI|nr:GntR family transcriptional regulator [Oceanobacillus bengalensis]RKQ14937.1 GntR family transcriptional regulator [Oceanobacillus bengalensis]
MNDDSILLRRPLGELIAEQLRQDIYNRRIELGDRLIEADLAERFDVSRSTIREALKILEQEKLVLSKARKGTFVCRFTEEDLDELTEVRLIIESRAFVKALTHMEDKDFNVLADILTEMKQEAEIGDWNKLFDLDMLFHQTVVNRCGNVRLVKIYESIRVQIRVYIAHLDRYYTSFNSFYKEHKDLYNVLLKRDAGLVKKKIEDHIEYVEEKLLRNNKS